VTLIVHPVPVVVDASVAVDLVGAGDPDLAAAWLTWSDDRRLRLAPVILWPELANALLRSRRLPGVLVAELVGAFAASGIEIADRGAAGVREAIVLAERHDLTIYDATYLWLAMDVDGELATRDRALVRAATATGVPLALP
jgi:predicted nucleic acid-binding protein